jgi:hypothetical protein
MKFLGILTAASLALAPAVAAAGSAAEKGDDNSRPIAGPLAVKPLEDRAMPAAALAAGGLFILAGVVFGAMGGSDNDVTPTTNTNNLPD